MIPINRILPFFVFITLTSDCFSQTIDTTLYRKDNLGSIKNQKRMIISGNNISTIIHNDGTIGKWPDSPSFQWPNDSSGLNYIDGLTFIVSAEVLTNKGQIIHPFETFYWDKMDKPSDFPGFPQSLASEPLGFSPLSGYDNSELSVFARSDEPATWPAIWPTALNLPESQNGKWLNRLFPFSKPANLETFFVMDDSKDFEFTYPFPLNRGKYYPIKNNEPAIGTTIQDELKFYTFNPNFRKGLGLRVESGTFQWNTSKLKNTLFVINEIFNLSDYKYESFSIGIFSDLSTSSFDVQAELGMYDKEFNAFIFHDSSMDNYFDYGALIFLDTPGNSSNNKDDDNDGLVDESQSNGIDDDGDWDIKLNDIGKDGIDNTKDEGEGDGIPTMGEPNFETSDTDEIDLLGIKSINELKNLQEYYLGNDEEIWNLTNSTSIHSPIDIAYNKILLGTNGFSFSFQSKIRFSYAVIFGKDLTDLYQNVKWAREAYSAGFTESSIGVGVKENHILQNKIQLNQNYPNPFNPITTLSFNLPVAQEVSLKVYDLLGREIQTLQSGYLNAGTHHFIFNGSKLTSGVYFSKLVSGNYSETKKMVLMK